MKKRKNEQFTPFSMMFSPTYNPADKYICYRWRDANICEIFSTKKNEASTNRLDPHNHEKIKGVKV